MIKASEKKVIGLLEKLIESLNSANFELDAWKIHAQIILERVFGNDTRKIKQIENISYDYSSWSLRDNTGVQSEMDICKATAKEILQASIQEIEILGIPNSSNDIDENETGYVEVQKLIGQFEDELKGSQIKELKLILKSKDKIEDKKNRIIGKFKEFGIDTAPTLLAGILLNNEISKVL